MTLLVGKWEVDTFLNGSNGPILSFVINDSRIATQPILGWTWPSHVIKVVIPTQPYYTKEDVVAALKQWNASQVWFQATFNLTAKPIYDLVLSNDTSSPAILISFNMTATNDIDWGFGGRILSESITNDTVTALTCGRLSILSSENGTPLNNVSFTNLAMHETGHCLGLNHVPRDGDLMNHVVASPYDLKSPSTVSLYALYQLYDYQGRFVPANTVYRLPQGILYEVSPLT